MIVCPNCNHSNPDGAVQCEACYTPLPSLTSCPSCGASVQSDASFCGQCGFDLRTLQGSTPASPIASTPPDPLEIDPLNLPAVEIPPLVEVEPLPPPEPVASGTTPSPSPEPPPPLPVEAPATPPPIPTAPVGATQLQINQAKLLHVQTNTIIELPSELTVIHLGKPNDRIPPTIDVSGFPDSEIVSRIHANIRVEGDVYYLEDVGSSNGTYVNNMPLAPGNRHRLRPGDRIALGKGDKVTFIFQSV